MQWGLAGTGAALPGACGLPLLWGSSGAETKAILHAHVSFKDTYLTQLHIRYLRRTLEICRQFYE